MELESLIYIGNQLGNDSAEWWKKVTAMSFSVEWHQVFVVWACLLDLIFSKQMTRNDNFVGIEVV